MNEKTLRTLAKNYAEGALDKESYRKERDAYLKAVLAGTVRVKPIDYRPPVDIQDLDATYENERTAVQAYQPQKNASPDKPDNNVNQNGQSPTTAQPSQSSGNPYLLASTVLLIIAAIGVSIALLQSPADTEDEANTIEITESDAIEEEPVFESPQTVSPAETLIKNFLQENNWNDNSLQEFKNDWQSLTRAEQQEGLASPMRAQLANAIHQKLVEERALMGLGDTESVIARQHKLVDFASALEIDDSRLKVEGESTMETSPQATPAGNNEDSTATTSQ